MARRVGTFARGILWPEQERGSDLDLMSMSDRATPSGRKRPAQKKWPLRRAAKFREETPRKGGGLAIKDRDTALQQYAEVQPCPQGTKHNSSRQNAAETLEKTVIIA